VVHRLAWPAPHATSNPLLHHPLHIYGIFCLMKRPWVGPAVDESRKEEERAATFRLYLEVAAARTMDEMGLCYADKMAN
jgi:hypothetical protein